MVTKLDITRVQQFLKRHDRDTIDLHTVVRLAELLTDTMLILLDGSDERTYNGLSRISKQITDTKRDLADFRASEMHDEKIPEAGRELDAVVEATESATNRIMEAAETIMAGDPSDLDAYVEMINNNVIEIFEACSFQDITGQRIAKVVRTLDMIESQIGTIILTLDLERRAKKEIIEKEDPQDVIGELLNGPALAGKGVKQNDIDAMFN
ncbi:MAG: protein phosphatase CheZ [Rhizobiales bacterium]|nr:protein phosphatase CheZ [Hyphomicrobiales bacterium]